MSRVLARFDIALKLIDDDAEIPASFWGAPEAGVIGQRVIARGDTPVHSILHEAGHVICMSGRRRAALVRDAGGNDIEESAVCYLQILLADFIDGAGRTRLMQDMDRWGYSFRLGSTAAWFSADAEDARRFLLLHGLIDARNRPTWALRC
ncbi:MAG: hypothetical protein AAGA44_16955 [Pseudomonadota bacterium]